MENPFVPGIMAWFLAGERVTSKEAFIYLLVTVGLYFISYKETALQLHAVGSDDESISYETIGIALTCVASGI